MTQIIIKNGNSIDKSKITLIDTSRNSNSRETDVKYIGKRVWKRVLFFFLKSFLMIVS